MLRTSGMFLIFINEILSLDTNLCRLRDGIYLRPEEFNRFTCGECLFYMPQREFVYKWKVDNQTGWLIPPWPNVTQNLVAPDPNNFSQVLYDSFISEGAFNRWKECCEAAAKCCIQQVQTKSENISINSLYDFNLSCPSTWDGWQCWTDASPGKIMEGSCPEYIWFQDFEQPCKDSSSFKTCLKSGKWFSDRNKEWTDFLECAQFTRIWAREITRLVAYIISALSLGPALLIFFLYRPLRAKRFAIHAQLSVSLLFHAVIVIVLKICQMVNPYIYNEQISATILVFCQRYFRLSNYFWMLNEGFYLHGLLATAFAKEKDMKILLFIGWGLPLIFVTIYSLLRMNQKVSWTEPIENLEWLLYGPCLFSLINNLCFLINIIRILFIQLKAIRIRTSESEQFRKTVKAILLLQILLGIHYLATLYKPGKSWNCWLVDVYYHLDYLLDGLQGSLVAIAFCYTNGEVITVVKRSYRNLIQKRRLSTNTTRNSNTVSL